jgi:hypothetical protein
MIRVKSMAVFFRHKYEIKIPAKKYLNDGLKFSLMFLEQARFQFQRLFDHYDTSGDGKIDFGEFKELVVSMDKDIPKWKIHALFQDATGTNDLDAGISFDDFVSAAMNNPLLDGIMELGYAKPMMQITNDSTVLDNENKTETDNSLSLPAIKENEEAKSPELGAFDGDEEEDSPDKAFGKKYLMLKENIHSVSNKHSDDASAFRRGSAMIKF